MGFETQYLKSTIGDILSDAFTEVLVTKPHDPVQFLGQWLLTYVKKQKKTDAVVLHSRKYFNQQEVKKASCNVNVNETSREEDLASKLQLQEDGTEVSDVYELWESLLRNVKSFTRLSATHIAVVLPEPKSLDHEAADEDSSNEDESLFSGISFEKDEEEEAKGETEDGIEEASDEQLKTYVEFLSLKGSVESLSGQTLHRPISQDADDDEPSETRPLASVFRLLEEGVSEYYVKSCVQESGMEFLLPTPKIGSCFMCALSGQETGKCEAVLICDSLCPPGNGSPIMKTDQELIAKLAKQTSEFMVKLMKDKSSIEGLCIDTIVGLKSTVESLHCASEAENEETAIVQPLEEADNAEERQNEQEEIQVLEKELKESRKSLKSKQAILEKEQRCLEAIQESIASVKTDAVCLLKSEIHPGEQLLSTLRNVLCLFGKEIKDKGSWSEIRCVVLNNLIDDLANYKHDEEHRIINMELSQEILSSTKILSNRKISQMTTPTEILDCLLCLFIKQAARISSQIREVESLTSSIEEQETNYKQKQTEMQNPEEDSTKKEDQDQAE